MAENKRESNIDCLRIISMLMVVCLHFFSHGGLSSALTPSLNWAAGNLLLAACFVAVNCFVIISGYYLCTSQFKLKKLANIWLQVFVYSVVCCIIVSVATGSFSLKELIKSAMTVTMRQYWFVTAYLLLYVVSPFLNCAIRAMNRKTHLLCCCTLLGIFSVLHNIIYISDFGGVNGGYSFLWFCVLYIVAAYVRLYIKKDSFGWKKPLFCYLICIAVVAGERIAAYYITPYIFGRVALTSLFYSNNSIPLVLASFSLFQFFRAVDIQNKVFSKLIGVLSPLAFGVYLIHDNRFVRPLLWGFIEPTRFADSPLLIPVVIAGTIAIFTVCCAVEWLRQLLFRKCGITGVINKVCDRIQSKTILWLRGDAGQIHS